MFQLTRLGANPCLPQSCPAPSALSPHRAPPRQPQTQKQKDTCLVSWPSATEVTSQHPLASQGDPELRLAPVCSIFGSKH